MVKNENPVRDRKNNIKYTGSVKKPDAVKKIDTVNDKKTGREEKLHSLPNGGPNGLPDGQDEAHLQIGLFSTRQRADVLKEILL